jgi:hypothetical protein
MSLYSFNDRSAKEFAMQNLDAYKSFLDDTGFIHGENAQREFFEAFQRKPRSLTVTIWETWEINATTLPAVPKEVPPKAAMFIASFLPKKERDCVLGDLLELFAIQIEVHGKRKARLRFWLGVLFGFWPPFVKTCRKWAEIFSKFKLK